VLPLVPCAPDALPRAAAVRFRVLLRCAAEKNEFCGDFPPSRGFLLEGVLHLTRSQSC